MSPTTLGRKFLRTQAPIVCGLIAIAILAAFLQHGYVPGAERPFALADARVPLWHLVWLGFWAGYLLALVGEAVGILALPYSMVVLQFTSVHVTPTIQVVTLINPIGALAHMWTQGRWNWTLASSVCAGGIAGGLAGPFLRVTVFADVELFRLLVVSALGVVGIYMIASALWPVGNPGSVEPVHAPAGAGASAGNPHPGLPARQGIVTTWQSRTIFSVTWRSTSWRFRVWGLLFLGFSVGLISSILGVGGGFLLVPLMLLLYRLPFPVLVGTTIPYTVVLSFISLTTYLWVLPWIFETDAVTPEWGWALLIAAGGVAGSWFALATQDYVPHRSLKLLLGILTIGGSLVYILES